MDLKYIGRIAVYFLIFGVLLALVVDICYHVISVNTVNTETVELTRGTIDLSVNTTATLVRDEKVIAMPDGYRMYSALEGERVASGTPIAQIFENTESVREIAARIEDADKKLEILKRAESLESSYTLSTVDKGITDIQTELAASAARGDVARSGELSDEYSVLLDIRKLKNGHKSNFKAEIKELEDEKAALIESLGSARETVKADTSGFLYTTCDGFENVFGSASVTDLSYEELAGAESAEPEDLSSSVKLVTDYRWYLIAPVESEQLVYFTEGKKYGVDLGDVRVDMRLERIVRKTGQKTQYIILLYDRIPDGLNISRKTDVKIIYKTGEGYIIPVRTLRELDGRTGVYVLHGSVVKFRAVSVTAMDDVYAVCDPDYTATDGDYLSLKFYDRVITKGEELYDGKIID